jgi:hypothetical protein
LLYLENSNFMMISKPYMSQTSFLIEEAKVCKYLLFLDTVLYGTKNTEQYSNIPLHHQSYIPHPLLPFLVLQIHHPEKENKTSILLLNITILSRSCMLVLT